MNGAANIPLSPKKKYLVIIASLLIFIYVSMLPLYGISIARTALLTEFNAMAYYSIMIVATSVAAGLMTAIGGKIGDIVGRKKLAIICLILHMITLIVQFFVQSFALLFAMQVIMSLLAGCLTGLFRAMISDVTTVQERPKFISYIGAITALAMMVGPLLGGVIVDTLGYRWVFPMSIPLGIFIVIVLATCYKNKPSGNPKIDWVGIILLAVGVVLFLGTMSLSGKMFAWGSAPNLIGIIGGVVLLVLFVLWERKAESPVMPISLFKHPSFRTICIITAVSMCYSTLSNNYVVLFAQTGLNMSATVSGTTGLIKNLISFVLPFLLGSWLVKRNMMARTKAVNVAGCASLVIGCLLMALLATTPLATASIYIASAFLGIGMALTKVGQQPLVQKDMPNEVMGAGLALFAFSQTMMNAVYPAIYGAINNSFDTINQSFPVMCYMCAVLCVIAGIIAVVKIKGEKAGKVEAAAE